MDSPKKEHQELSLPSLQYTDSDYDAKPEGNAKALCTLAGGWLALFATFGYISSFGVYQDLYVLSGTSSSSNISWIGSVQIWCLSAMALPAGSLLDKGYFKSIVFCGTIIYLFSLFMLSLVHIDHYYQIFMSQGLGMGIGAGIIYAPAMAVQAHHWKAHRSLVMGLVITGSSVGGIVYPIMLNNLFNSSVGFAGGVRASAYLTTGLLVFANCLMSAKPRGDITGRSKAKLGDIIRDTPYMVVVIGGFFSCWNLFFPYFYLQLFTNLHQLSSTFAFYTLTIQNGASIFGRTIPNLLADKLGMINTFVVIAFCTGISVSGLLWIDSVEGVTAFAIIYGFFSGAVLSLSAPTLATFARSESEIGIRLGISYFVSSFGFLTGPPIAGALLGGQIRWDRPVIFSGVTVLAGSIPFLLLGRMLQARRKGTQFV